MPVTDTRPSPPPAPPRLLIDRAARTVALDGQTVEVKARAFDLLVALASDPERVFSGDELKAAAWAGRTVEDNSLRMQVQAVRRALGQDAVLNVPGRGYKLALGARWCRAERPAGNLPCWPELLIGRDGDVVELDALLAEHRLVTLLGPGGIGKTRLAQHLSREHHDRHPAGAWWVDLASVAPGPTAAQAAAQAIGAALNLQTGGGKDGAPGAALVRALSGWQGLLLLDNADRLAGDPDALPALVRALLEGAPGLWLLVTSQQPLDLPEEWVYRLDPLEVPPLRASPAQARASAALQLLERRARASSRSFVLADADVPGAAELVRRLDGIPLAIEMLAPQLPVLGVPTLLGRFAAHLHLQGAGRCEPHARQRTMRAALDWSHGLLGAGEQAALRQLSVFAAPFRLETACEVVRVPGLDEPGVLQVVLGLMRKSLLQPVPVAPGATAMRMRLLETTRLYAEQALAERPDERESALLRHVQAMAALAARARRHFLEASDVAWTSAWLPDLEDLAVAFDRAHARGDAESAAQIIELLVLGSNVTGRVDAALARSAASHALAAAASPLARARLLGWGSYVLADGLSRSAAAERRVQVWRDVAAPEGPQGLCVALSVLAVACEEAGDRAGADLALAECRRIEDPTWSPRLRRRCTWLAVSRMAVLRNDEALRTQCTALSAQLARQLGDLGAWRERSIVRLHMLHLLRLQGRHAEAIVQLRDLAQEQLALGCGVDAGLTHAHLCAVLMEASLGDDSPELPLGAAQAAIEALERIAPLPHLIRHLVEALALLACRWDEHEHAALLLAGADRLHQELQHGDHLVNARLSAQARSEIGRRLDAARRELAEELGQRLASAELRRLALEWLRRRMAPPRGAPAPQPTLTPAT